MALILHVVLANPSFIGLERDYLRAGIPLGGATQGNLVGESLLNLTVMAMLEPLGAGSQVP
jgi:hypothetical protein